MSYNLEQALGGYFNLTTGGLAAGTNSGTIKTATTITPICDGVFTTKAATDNISLAPAALPNTSPYVNDGVALGTIPAGKQGFFGVWINSGGTFSTNQGPVAAIGDLLEPPPVVSDKALVGLVKIVTTTNAFVAGTTALNATGVTASYLNCAIMPGSAR